MIRYILFILVVSISLSQSLIETKEYKFYKGRDAENLNIMELINEKEGLFKVKLIIVDDIKYDRVKKLLVLPCELEISLLSDLSENTIDYKICNDKILSDDYLLIDEKYPIIKITEDKFKYVEAESTFNVINKNHYKRTMMELQRESSNSLSGCVNQHKRQCHISEDRFKFGHIDRQF